MITRGLSCDRVEFGHYGGGQMTPPSPTGYGPAELEALGERRPPWPRQIITPILPNVTMVSLGSERLTPKVLDHYLHHVLGMLPLL